MEAESNKILKKELTLKGKNNKSFKLAIIKENDEIRFESNILDDICNIQYSANLNIEQFYNNNIIFKRYKSIDELYSKTLKNIEEKEIVMSLNNNKIETNLNIDNNKILFILESKEIKLDNIVINKINEYIDILKNEIKKQKADNEKNIKELKNEIENMKMDLDIIRHNIPMGNLNHMNRPINNMNMMNNMNMSMNNMNMPMNNMNMQMNNNGPNTLPITFIASTGSITTMEIEKTKTIEDMLKEYVKKIDLPEDTIGEQIKFFYIDNQLDFKSKRKVESHFRNCPIISINVIDIGNIIPYWHITFDASPLNITEMEINKNKTIKDMMEAYAKEIGFPKEEIGEEVIFLYEGVSLDTKENDIVENVLREEKFVKIFDKSNLIGKLIKNDFTEFYPNLRGTKDLIPKNPRTSIDDEGYIISITFSESTGRKVIINMNSNKTIEDMCKEYANKIDFPVDSIGKYFMLLYNGAQLDYKSQSILGSIFRKAGLISVYELGCSFKCWHIRFVKGNNEFSLIIDQRRKIKYMMEAYTYKICVPKEDIGKKIVFLYNGKDLSAKENDSIESVLCDKAIITVNHII